MKNLIESAQNKFVKKIKGLQQHKNREKEGLFVVEGLRFVAEIPQNYSILFYAVSNRFQNKNDISVYQKRSQVLVFADTIFSTMTDTEHSQGILAVCQKKENTEFYFKQNGLYLLIEEVQDPGNLDRKSVV